MTHHVPAELQNYVRQSIFLNTLTLIKHIKLTM